MSISPLVGISGLNANPHDDAQTKIKKVGEAASEFEAVLLRQLLQSAKVGGDKSSQGYGSMVVDAMATGIVQGGGLGLAKQLQESLTKQYDKQLHATEKKSG